MNTAEFLLWAIEYSCPVRGFQDGSDPERTERQLRAARAVSDARRDGRVFEGLCVRPPDGFRIGDALAVYGGLAAVEHACGGCPANAIARVHSQSLAGCFGFVPLPADETQMHAAVERAIERAGVADEVQRLFAATQPWWYGLWMASPLGNEQANTIARLLADGEIVEIGGKSIGEFSLGLQAALAAGLRMHVSLHPRGVVEGTRWRLVRHCPRCRAPWPTGSEGRGRPEVNTTCGVCGHSSHPASEKKRMARGQRPYFSLDRLLGTEQAEQFLVRYAEFQARQELPELDEIMRGVAAGRRPTPRGTQRESPDREQTPLPEVQPDSLPAD